MSIITLEQVEKEYGKVDVFVNHLRELNAVNDLRQSDISEALRDINFILSKAEQNEISEYDLLERLV